jgi:hypothetical protein
VVIVAIRAVSRRRGGAKQMSAWHARILAYRVAALAAAEIHERHTAQTALGNKGGLPKAERRPDRLDIDETGFHFQSKVLSVGD